METYVSLVTGAGKPGANNAAREAIEAAGCKEVATYILMGQYDVLVIIEAPDAMSANAAIWGARKAASVGESHSQTMRAFTAAEMEKMTNLVR